MLYYSHTAGNMRRLYSSMATSNNNYLKKMFRVKHLLSDAKFGKYLSIYIFYIDFTY